MNEFHRTPIELGRRSFLTWALLSSLAIAKDSEDDDSAEEAKAIIQLGEKAKLKPFRTMNSARFRIYGDAPDSFLKLTLADCEAVAGDFISYYKGLGFPIKPSNQKLSVVGLSDDRAFAAFLGLPPNTALNGIYNHTTNRLVVYDFRQSGPQIPIRPGYANLRTLAHETTHQLSFNFGLFERVGDVPAALVEGLAMLGEVRKFDQPSPPGRVNSLRLENLASLRRSKLPWIPLKKLIAEDTIIKGVFGGGPMLLAYAQAWLLVYALMSDPKKRKGFQNYLEVIRPRRSPDLRVEDATSHWGDLDTLDLELQAMSIDLLKKNY